VLDERRFRSPGTAARERAHVDVSDDKVARRCERQHRLTGGPRRNCSEGSCATRAATVEDVVGGECAEDGFGEDMWDPSRFDEIVVSCRPSLSCRTGCFPRSETRRRRPGPSSRLRIGSFSGSSRARRPMALYWRAARGCSRTPLPGGCLAALHPPPRPRALGFAGAIEVKAGIA
jgi:hypothetical protein